MRDQTCWLERYSYSITSVREVGLLSLEGADAKTETDQQLDGYVLRVQSQMYGQQPFQNPSCHRLSESERSRHCPSRLCYVSVDFVYV